jgi:predicted transcriptional regulator
MFIPTISHKTARDNALKHLLQTFFDNSTEKAVAALLDLSEKQLSEKDYYRLLELIEEAQKEGR